MKIWVNELNAGVDFEIIVIKVVDELYDCFTTMHLLQTKAIYSTAIEKRIWKEVWEGRKFKINMVVLT